MELYSHLFKGTAKITKLILREQRFRIIIWLISLVGITLAAASAYAGIYEDEASRQAFGLTVENPAMEAMIGPGYELVDYVNTIGAILSTEMLLFTAIAVAIMSVLLVGKGTRGDEEDGRLELIRAHSVGRLAYMSATLIVNIGTLLLLTFLIGFGLIALGIEDISMEGSLLYGVILGTTGLLFGSITAIFAQVFETSRGTTMFSVIVLILAYLLRAFGDVSSDIMSWISPLGWTVRTGVFVDNNWIPVIIALLVSVLLILFAFYLNTIRDVGAGFIATRTGKKHASAFLKTPIGLSFRLTRTNIISWAIGIFLISAAFGAVLGDLEAYFTDIEFVQGFLDESAGSTITEQFITLLMAIMALVGLIPAAMTVLKLKGEEKYNYTENVYSRALSRTASLGSYILLAIIVSILMQLLTVLGLWSVSWSVMDEPLAFETMLKSGFVFLPAMWIVIGLAVLFIGVFPKVTGMVWMYVVYCFIVLYLKGILDFPEWVNSLSVFEHIPQIPAEEINWMTMSVLTVIAVVLTIIGFIGYNKRDILG